MKQINFASNLRAERIGRKITQSELAKVLGVDQRTISAWENAVCQPSYEQLAKICELFDVSFDDILL